MHNLQGNVLVSMQHPNNDAILMNVLGQHFLIVNSTAEGVRKMDEYVVPYQYAAQVEAHVQNNRIADSMLLRDLDRETVDANREYYLQKLLERPELDLIRDAAFALGNTGVTGAENPAAMVFYAHAMRFSKLTDRAQSAAEYYAAYPGFARHKRASSCGSGWTDGGSYMCPDNGRCCASASNCPTGTKNASGCVGTAAFAGCLCVATAATTKAVPSTMRAVQSI